MQATDASGTAAQASGLDQRAHLLRRRLAGGQRPAGESIATGTRARSRCASAPSTRRATWPPRRGRSRSTSRPRRSIDRKTSQRADYRSSRRSRRPARNVGCRAVRVPSGEPELVRAAGGGGSRCVRRVVGRLRRARLRLLPARPGARRRGGRRGAGRLPARPRRAREPRARGRELRHGRLPRRAHDVLRPAGARPRARAARAAARRRACRPPLRGCARSSAPRSP